MAIENIVKARCSKCGEDTPVPRGILSAPPVCDECIRKEQSEKVR